jgi:hypothetical protein
MTFTPEFFLAVGTALASGFGAYAAIRADLATLHERATNAIKSADKAHERIDHLQGAK